MRLSKLLGPAAGLPLHVRSVRTLAVARNAARCWYVAVPAAQRPVLQLSAGWNHSMKRSLCCFEDGLSVAARRGWNP